MNPLLPNLATVREVIPETGSEDVKTFRVELEDPDKAFSFRPGQCAMVSVFGAGESMISISSDPLSPGPLEISVKRVGKVTAALHELEPGSKIGIRGPYGNGFPVESWHGKNLLFIGGGIGLAPLRSLISYCLHRRERFGEFHIVYGARSPQDLCFKRDLFDTWPKRGDLRLDVTVDAGDETWKGPVGLVPHFLESLSPSPKDAIAVTCGPPIMIKFTLMSLEKLGFSDEQVFTTLELKMQCGVGKCGRCNIGPKYVCIDGPVFSLKELKALPQEY